MKTSFFRFAAVMALLGPALAGTGPVHASGGNLLDHFYEIWASDQSNSVPGQTSRGVAGSYVWIWNSWEMEIQLNGGPAAQPVGCDGFWSAGPCDINELFPATLAERDVNGATGNTLGTSGGAFGRLHGMLPDPQHRYMNVNLFAPGAGYVGIMDGITKEAVALFRVTGTNAGRSVHMSFWNADGSALLVANLNGKILERIDITRNKLGRITGATFNQSASLGVGKGMVVTDSAKVYRGANHRGRQMLGKVAGSYDAAALADTTPNGACKENGCGAGDGGAGGRPNNLIICPIVSDDGNVYVTMGGGGLLVADSSTTPMSIIGEYGNQVINGAGCGGVQEGNEVWLNAGVSASPAGATWSTFTMYTLDDSQFGGVPNPENTPLPTVVFQDPGNTATGGNLIGPAANNSGQLPGTTTRRDAHGAAKTTSGSHIHNVDRIQNNAEVFHTVSKSRTTYDLTTGGACGTASVSDDPGLPTNDPAPDLMDTTPDGKYMMVALRGPVPVSVDHSAQGSCPGVGIIRVKDGGASGELVGVLRSTNTVDTVPVNAPEPGGHQYTGAERSDPHGASVRRKVPYIIR
ncbi:MAG: hypothetical protein KKE76_08115 [Gammaproteobacteria bacterium]|nr:hypothetical protein [Gammaproteobacteria bacterium]